MDTDQVYEYKLTQYHENLMCLPTRLDALFSQILIMIMQCLLHLIRRCLKMNHSDLSVGGLISFTMTQERIAWCKL